MKKKRVCVYLRVDSCSELDDVERQKEIICEYVKRKLNNSFIEYYIDDGYSGRDFNRPTINKLINDTESNEIDIIVVSDYSKISRNLIDLYKFVNEYLIPRNIQLISSKEGPYKDYVKNIDYIIKHN